MKASARARVRRLFCLASSGTVCVALTMGGCGPSADTPQELTPEAKKALAVVKGTDLSKYAKPKDKAKKRR